MITKKHMLIFGFAVCAALLLFALCVAKDFEERPFKIHGTIIATIDVRTCGTGICQSVILEDWGEATHTGRFNMNTQNLAVYANGDIIGDVILTAANGDQLFLQRNNHDFTFTGGTGRFVNALGEYQIEHPPATVTWPNAYTMVVTHPYEGVGTITY